MLHPLSTLTNLIEMILKFVFSKVSLQATHLLAYSLISVSLRELNYIRKTDFT